MADSFSTTKYSGNELSVTANGVTMKSVAEVALTPETVTEILPVEVVAGTVTVIEVAELSLTMAGTPLNMTTLFVSTLLKPVPLIVIAVPITATAGENEVMVSGRTKNSDVLNTVTPSRSTLILPVVAPVGTVTVKLVDVLDVNSAVVPLNFTT